MAGDAPKPHMEDVTTADPAAPAGGVSFRRVYEEGFGYVHHTLLRLGVRSADVEDVAHDVFVAVHRHLAAYDPARPLRPWLFGFAYRTAGDYRKLARHRREADAEPPDAPDERPLPDEFAARSEARATLMEILGTFSYEQRAVFVLHEVDGESVPVIAETLGVPLNTAYSRLRLARRAFDLAVEERRLALDATGDEPADAAGTTEGAPVIAVPAKGGAT